MTIASMDTGTAQPEQLRARLTRQRRAAIRAVLGTLADGSAPLLTASVIVGPNPLGVEERTWKYRMITFVSGVVPVKRLAAFLNPDELRLASATISAEFQKPRSRGSESRAWRSMTSFRWRGRRSFTGLISRITRVLAFRAILSAMVRRRRFRHSAQHSMPLCMTNSLSADVVGQPEQFWRALSSLR